MQVKNRDIPTELREFNSLFSFIARKHDAQRVFDDFLTLVVCCLARQTQETWYLNTIRKYDKDDINIFPKLLGSLFIIYDTAIFNGDWCDPLGDFYQEISGKYKKSGMGQFFTPKSICDIMTQITIQPNEFGKNISEPTCGSGRMILSINNFAKGNYFVAADLDPMCVKMTCINLAIHGIKAEVHQQNSLSQETPYNSYVINHDYHKTKTPFIYKISP